MSELGFNQIMLHCKAFVSLLYELVFTLYLHICFFATLTVFRAAQI